jgi:opacity protein-like surface antigen
MVLGVGVELAVADHWIARVEGDWINYPRTDVTLTGTSSFVGAPPITTSAFNNLFSEFATKGLIKAALSYKF